MLHISAQPDLKDTTPGEKDFGRIYDDHFDALFKYVLHRVANVADAEDLTAQIFFRALRNLWRFRWTGIPIKAWLFRIATNEVNGYFRTRGRRRHAQIEAHADELNDIRSQTDGELAEAERTLAQHRAFMELAAAIQALKPGDQALIVLRYFEGKTYSEIGQIIGKREGAATMRAHRALAKLKRELEKRGIDHARFKEGFEDDGQAGRQVGRFQAESAP